MRISILALALVVAVSASPLSGELVSTTNTYKFTVVAVPDTDQTFVNRVNEGGELLGDFRRLALADRATHGFLISGGVFTQLDFPGAEDTFAADFDNHGVVVGWASPGPLGYVFDRATAGFTEDARGDHVRTGCRGARTERHCPKPVMDRCIRPLRADWAVAVSSRATVGV